MLSVFDVSNSIKKKKNLHFLLHFSPSIILFFVEPSGVQSLKNPNPLKDVEALVVLVVVVLS